MPYERMSEVPSSLRGIEPAITLAQANEIARCADRVEEEGDVESPWAACIAQFKKTHRAEGGKWVRRKKEEKAMDVFEIEGVEVTLDELKAAYKAESERDKLRKAQDARSKRYGIGVKEPRTLTPPKGYPTDESLYGDPVNYHYPMDARRLLPARQYFNREGQREDGGYTMAEWAIIGKRIAKHSGADYLYKNGKVVRKEGKSLAVKMLREEDSGVVVGGPLLLWGNEKHKDLQGEYFTPDTWLGLDVYKSVPTLFHHGLDSTVGLTVMGHRIKSEMRDQGVWVEDWLDKHSKYWALVKPLLEAEALYYSPGSTPHLVQKEDDGRLKSFPVVEDTLTPIPAQHRLRPIEQIKAAYKSADLDLPDGLEPEPEPAEGGGDAGASRLEAEMAKAKAKAEATLTLIDTLEV